MHAPLKGLMLASGALALTALTLPTSALAASPPPASARTVTIDNTRPDPVVVYLERGEMDTKLGTVGADAEGVLRVPEYLDRDETARIVVHPQVGLDLRSPDIVVPKQGTLKVLVPNNDTGYLPQPKEMMPGLNPDATTLTVENPRSEAVNVTIQYGQFDKRIGTVGPDQVHTFTLPEWLTREPSDVQVFLEPKTGLEMSSADITLRPKAHLEVTVPQYH